MAASGGGVVHNLRVYGVLFSASLRGQMSYRSSFALELLGRSLMTGFEVLPIFFIFNLLQGELRGFSQWEVVYLYGSACLSMGMAEVLCTGLERVSVLVRDGTFDRLLLRPAGALTQVLGQNLRLFKLGRALQGAVALTVAVAQLELDWHLGRIVMLIIALLSGVMIYGALFLAAAANCFWTVERNEMFNIFTFGGVEMCQYPLTAYRPWLRHLFLFVVPVGFVSYFPALAVLGKTDSLGYPAYFAQLAPVVAGTTLAAAYGLWRLGLQRYQSTGS